MKLIRFLLSLSVLVGCVAADICAQTSSSASQTVTFGVHRSTPVVVASAQTSTISVSEMGFERTSPLKITVGSDVRSHVLSEISNVPSQRSFAEYKSSLSAVKSFSIKSSSAEKPVVTLTE
ncbi:MAG: hypothetical protein ABSE41_17280 [Bacteroidota bacterium]